MADWGGKCAESLSAEVRGQDGRRSADAAIRRRQCPRISAENLTTRRASIDLIVENWGAAHAVKPRPLRRTTLRLAEANSIDVLIDRGEQ